MNETINQRVAKCRRLANLTQIEVAEKMGMKGSTYSQMERKGNISAERLVALAEICGVNPDILLYGEQPNTNPEPVAEPEKAKEELPRASQTPFYNRPEFMNTFIFSKKEENIIKIIRNLPKKAKEEVISFIEKKYKESK